MDSSDLAVRMKTYYEKIPQTKLIRRTPVAIRIDGKAFHSYTRGFQKPFDKVLIKSMQDTMKYLCENIQGCVFGYTQSDEITLILIDYQNLNSSAWFDYKAQKLCSISASMATMAFNKFFDKNYLENIANRYYWSEEIPDYILAEDRARKKGAMFDSRCFNIPKEEVTNLIYWRQLDAIRNSIQMVGQANFPYKELQNKSCNDVQDMLMEQKGINWNDYPAHQKRGSCCIKTKKNITEHNSDETMKLGKGRKKVAAIIERPHWIIDTEIPIFKGEGRKYIDNLVFIESEN